jgi:hypothetical protein
MRKTLIKGSKEAKAFMAKLRAKKASATKSVKTVATNVKRIAKGAKKAFRDGYYAKDKVKAIGGKTITLSKAKEIASNWHGGQFSALYQFASSGVILKENYNRYFNELPKPNIDNLSKKDLTDIKQLIDYIVTNYNKIYSGKKFAGVKDKVGATGKTKWIFSVYKRDEFGDAIPSSKKTMIVTRVNQSTALEVVYRKYPYKNYWASLSDAEYIGSTLLIEKGENPRKRPTRVIQINRTKKGLFKKFSKVSGVNHKDTKSHKVNIRVVSGVSRKTGFIGGLIIKKYTLSELKKINPIYFDKGNDKFFGVYKRKLIVSKKLNSQVMIEASKNVFGGETIRKYSVRLIKPNGQIDSPKSFETLFGASDYIGKNIIL